MSVEETERERHLHAMYDAWKWLQREAELREDNARFAEASRAILRGQLEAADYPREGIILVWAEKGHRAALNRCKQHDGLGVGSG